MIWGHRRITIKKGQVTRCLDAWGIRQRFDTGCPCGEMQEGCFYTSANVMFKHGSALKAEGRRWWHMLYTSSTDNSTLGKHWNYRFNTTFGSTIQHKPIQELFSNPWHKVMALMKRRASEVRETIKNCANEVPESNSITFASAMCNAGLKP